MEAEPAVGTALTGRVRHQLSKVHKQWTDSLSQIATLMTYARNKFTLMSHATRE